jgi:hypothetical protein
VTAHSSDRVAALAGTRASAIPRPRVGVRSNQRTRSEAGAMEYRIDREGLAEFIVRQVELTT